MLTQATQAAAVELAPKGDGLEVSLRGAWRMQGERPKPAQLDTGAGKPKWVQVSLAEGAEWDTSLVLWLSHFRARCAELGIEWREAEVPDAVRKLVAAAKPVEKERPQRELLSPVTSLGLVTHALVARGRDMIHFLGELALSAAAAARTPHRFRWRDCLWEMQQCGAMALPIVGLVSFLVGVTLAYTGAIILRQYGGDIYVADLIGLSMVREMGAMMTAVVLAGRTGAAFAAQLANMKANEEIDALETFGFRAFDFLVLPRMVALAVMMPMLVVYAMLLGILGGMAIALAILNIPPTAFFVEMATTVGLLDILTGLIKATTFGVIVGMSGCYHGLRAEPNAQGVGSAATSAVVTAILLVIIADAVYAVVFNALGW
ncbi:MlaE family ABC transporter permease [Nibricoccus sp. IMCC34717]|uniref:MlaE family ABC transporter permease n=1 Tax=Nibricoccus sp. IMCC34717 TaxID=3034021 RepID=UPI00384DA22C